MKNISRLHPMGRKFVLKTLVVATALCFGPAARAQTTAGLPTDGSVVRGDVTINPVAGNNLTINQSSARAVLDWRTFNIDFGKMVEFMQPSALAAILNRVTGDVNPSQILGSLKANGNVLLMNPNGIVFGPTAVVNVAGLVATTGTIDENKFYQTGVVAITGAIGSILNQGNITISNAGLAALVAPSVRNEGFITATGGKVVLAGVSAATISMNDGLYEFVTGAAGARVSNSGEIKADGGAVLLTAANASAVIDNVINMDGIIQARTVGMRNGSIVLEAVGAGGVQVAGRLDVTGADGTTGGKITVTGSSVELTTTARLDASGDTGGGTILVGGGRQGKGPERNAQTTTVAAGATIKADALTSGNGGTIIAWANDHGSYAGQFSARGGSTGGNGGFIETSGMTVDFAPTLSINASAVNGVAGKWLIDPADITIDSTLAATLAAVLASGTSTEVTTSSGSGGSGDLILAASINAAATGGADLTLTGRHLSRTGANTVNISGTGSSLILNVNAVNPSANVTGPWIQDALNMIGTVSGGTMVKLGAGTYTESVTVNKANLTITGTEGTNLRVSEGQTGFDISANGVTIEGMQITGPYSQNFKDIVWNPPSPQISPSTTGIMVGAGVSGARIRNNTIKNVRSGIQVLNNATVDITGNTIDNTKGSILVHSDNVTMSGNIRGSTGNEWDIVFLDGVTGGAYFTSPTVSQTQYGSGMMAMSRANGDMYILDRRYGSRGLLGSTPQFGNRSHITVKENSNFTAADDFNLGNGLGNDRQPFGLIADGINAVVSGGVVKVAAGNYSVSSISIDKSVSLLGPNTGISGSSASRIEEAIITGTNPSGPAFRINTAGPVTFDGLQFKDGLTQPIDSYFTGSNITLRNNVFSNLATGLFFSNPATLTVERNRFTNVSSNDSIFVAGNWNGTTGTSVTIRDNLFENPNTQASGLNLSNVSGLVTGNTFKDLKYYGILLANNSSNIAITNNLFDGITNPDPGGSTSWGAGIRFYTPAITRPVVITGNTFTNSAIGISVRAVPGAIPNLTGMDIQIADNSFLGNAQAIRHEGTGTLNASRNWWGTTDATAVAARMTGSGPVDFTPFLGSGVDADPATAGFQGNRDTLNVTSLGAQAGSSSRIQEGVDMVNVGGTVNVTAGTYAESVSITKALTLAGAGRTNSFIAPTSGNAVTVSGNIGASSDVLIDGFTFRNAPGAGVSVANDTVLRRLTVRNSAFLHNGTFGFFANGSALTGIPGLQNVSLLNSTFTGNGAPYTSATSLGQGDINFNYYNGNATLKDLRITGETEHIGIQFRGYHDNVTSGGVHDAGTLVFDNVTIDGSFRRPSGSAGTWNPSGPGDAIHMLEYGSVANVSFNNVTITPTVGHGMFLEGLSSTLDIGNTSFGAPDSLLAGTGTNPTRSWNIYSGSNDRNNVKTNVKATSASFTGATNGFAIEDRVFHALDVTGLGVINWNAGNLYVTQASGSIQRGVDAAAVGNTVNIAEGTYTQSSTLDINKSLTLAGASEAGTIIDARNVSGYGIKVTGDHVWLKDFTLYGPTANVSSSYGIKVQPADGVVTSRLRDFNIDHVTSRGAGRAELDLHAVDGATIDHFTANGAPVNPASGASTAGAGIQITDSANVTVSNSTTLNNDWGGLALYQANRYYNQQTTGIVIEGNNHFNERNPVYLQDESTTRNFGALSIAGFDYAVRNSATEGSGQYTWMQASSENAINFAVNTASINTAFSPVSSYVQGWSGTATTQNFEVGIGSMLAGGTRAMSIATALNASASGANIRVRQGSYAEQVVLSDARNLTFEGATISGFTANAGAAGSGIGGSVTADTATGFSINAPIVLLADTTLTTRGANIVINGDIQGRPGMSPSLFLRAGAGATRGNVTLLTGGTASHPLGRLDVVANNFTLLDTLWVGRYGIDAVSNVALSNHTLRALDTGVTNTIAAGGNVSGTTVSSGNSQVSGGGDVTANVSAQGDASVSGASVGGNITGNNVDVDSAGVVNANVSAANTASVAGGDVSGTINAPTASVDATGNVQVVLNSTTAVVHADGNANVSGTVSNITVEAPTGSLSGSFGQVSNTGSSVLAVNGRPQASDALTQSADNGRLVPVEGAFPGAGVESRPASASSPGAASISGFTGEAGAVAPVEMAAPNQIGEFLLLDRAVEIDLTPGSGPARR